jgi:WD domain, G-beta repeat/Caspase domain
LRGTVPAPDLPSGLRSALIIATATYEDAGLGRLRAPGRDAAGLAGVLGDQEIGGFAVTQVIDQGKGQIELSIARFLSGRDTRELVVVYLSCHGVLDGRGRLYFAATDTKTELLSATGVESSWLVERLEECRARQQVIILDCCFSGAFARGRKGRVDLGNKLAGRGRGRVVLTASRDGEYSFEGQSLTGQDVRSVFTAGLIQGLSSGAADGDQDGLVTAEDAYDYAVGYVREHGGAQSPQRWVFAGEDQIVLARSPMGVMISAAELPEHVRVSLDSPHPHVRVGAVHVLGELLSGLDPAVALTARQTLELIADQDVSAVATTSRAYLEAVRPVPVSPAFIKSEEEPNQYTNVGGGALIATASDDKTARVWDTDTGTCRLILKSHKGTVDTVVFSPDGALIGAASDSKTVRVWDTDTGTCKLILEGHKRQVIAVVFSPDGTLIATASTDGTARVWDTATGKCRRILKGHKEFLAAVVFSPDGTLIATGSDDWTVRVWYTDTGTCRLILKGHKNTVKPVVFSPDGTLIATASLSKTARVWDTDTGTCRLILKGHEEMIDTLVFSPDGSLIATASTDKTTRVWDTDTGTCRLILKGHTDWVNAVAFSPGALDQYRNGVSHEV